MYLLLLIGNKTYKKKDWNINFKEYEVSVITTWNHYEEWNALQCVAAA